MRLTLAFSLFLPFLQTCRGSRPNDLSFTASEVEENGCREECQASLEQGLNADHDIFRGVPFDHDFYTTADNFSDAKPGDVLKLQPYNISGLSIPPSLSAFKLQYVSLGLGGEKVPVTAFIAIPFLGDSATGQKARLVAFAHGTIGVVPSCAPSSSYNFYDYYTWQPLSVAGYAVVATDYAGLGNNFTAHKYINPVSNGEDVYWSVVAARRAFPHLFTTRWATVGHSQGGGSVWGLAENPRVLDAEVSGEYVGGVALAPGARVYDMLADHARAGELNAQHPAGKYVSLFAKAIQSVHPAAEVDFLSAAAEQRHNLINELQLCLHGSGAVDAGLPHGGLKSPTPVVDSKQLQAFQADYGAALGNKRQFRDLLVLQGTGDRTEGSNATINAYEAACAAGNTVHLSLYPGLDHRPVLTASIPEWLPWLDTKFQGAPDWHGCEKRTREPLVGVG